MTGNLAGLRPLQWRSNSPGGSVSEDGEVNDKVSHSSPMLNHYHQLCCVEGIVSSPSWDTSGPGLCVSGWFMVLDGDSGDRGALQQISNFSGVLRNARRLHKVFLVVKAAVAHMYHGRKDRRCNRWALETRRVKLRARTWDLGLYIGSG